MGILKKIIDKSPLGTVLGTLLVGGGVGAGSVPISGKAIEVIVNKVDERVQEQFDNVGSEILRLENRINVHEHGDPIPISDENQVTFQEVNSLDKDNNYKELIQELKDHIDSNVYYTCKE